MFHPANLVRLAVVATMLLGLVSIRLTRAQLDPDAAVQVERAVVQLSAWAQGTEDGELTERVLPRGSGTLVSPDGLILTASHVVNLDPARLQWEQEAEEARRQGRTLELEPRATFVVSLVLDPGASTEPDRRYTATVVVDRPEYDLAVLRITGGIRGQALRGEVTGLPFVELGNSDDLAERQQLHVFGYPFSVPGLVPSEAVVSRLQDEEGVLGWAWIIVSNATITGGNSGGAAVDDAGRLVGVPIRVTQQECPQGDTNGDGITDERDGCVPAGGSFGLLRPINLAKPLLGEAGLSTPATAATQTPTAVSSPSATSTTTATVQLTATPTETPTLQPTETPTEEPTATPTQEPTTTPTLEPTETPTLEPTETATTEPTGTATPEPTETPTAEPAVLPTPIDTGPPVMYLGNPAHTGNQDAVGPDGEPERLWRVKTGYRPRSSPAVAAGTVYVGGDAGLFALDAATGNQRWLFETEEEISASPAVIEGVVYVGGADGIFYAVDAGTGMERWQFKTGGKIRASAAIADGVIYFTSFDGYIYALDIASGTELWRYETELDDLTSSPAVADGVLYFGGGRIEGGSVYALDVSARESHWKNPVRVAGTVGSSPMVLDGFVYVGSDVGTLYGIDAESGKIVCRFDTGRLVRSSPSTYEGMILIGNRKQSLFALAGGGNCDSLVWEFKVRDWIDSPPTVAGDTIYFGSLDNYLYALDANTRQIRWQYETGGGILTSPAVADGVVYFTSRDGYVYAYGES